MRSRPRQPRLGLWCLTIFQLFRGCHAVLLVEETGVPGESHRPAASSWQTLSPNVISSLILGQGAHCTTVR